MSVEQDRAVLEEALRRERIKQAKGLLINGIRDELFSNQLDFIDDKSREKGALCTRRAGKTSMWTRYCTIVAMLVPRSIIRIWGITRLRAKQLLWEEFKYLFARHRLLDGRDYTANETELTIKFLGNGSEIRLLGADKDKEAQKKRGDKTIMEVVLEAQLFGGYLQKLVDDVAGPCLFDLKGTFCLEGTPGPICTGYWFDVSGGDDLAKRWTSNGNKKTGVGAGWAMHRWSVLDNPFLPHAREELAEIKRKRRWADTNPTYVREWLARWVNDLSAMFYKFDPIRNVFTLDQLKPWGPGWEHVLGWDLGFKDDMAMVVWGYHSRFANLYEAFSWKKPGALSPEIVAIVRELEGRGVDGVPFNLTRRFADTGGGGKMFVEEVVQRYGIPFEAAKKSEKYEHVRLLNDDLLGGFLKLQAGSPYAEEIAALPRDPDWPGPDEPEKAPREHPGSPNHCCDAGLYAYRGSWHYLHRDEPAIIVPGSPAWFAAEAARMEQHVLSKVQQRLRAAEEWGSYDEYE